MKKFTIPHGTACEFEIYDHNDSLCEVHRSTNVGDIIFSETQLKEEENLVGSDGTFMRFGSRKNDTMTEGDFYEYVVVDTEYVIVENR